MRKRRKEEHIENYLRTTYKGNSLLDCIYLEHNALPELNIDDINTQIKFLGKNISYPIIINAMTGGTKLAGSINKDLAQLAKHYNIPMAVGSETIALCDEESCKESFKVTREIVGKDGIIIANLNGYATVEDAKRALDLVDGDALQIHLNPAQELSMSEGDRSFKGILSNIETLVNSIDKPVIVKEVGFGISRSVAKKLYNIGVKYIDISGHGGTNFIEIEDLRNFKLNLTELYCWGIPTALSLYECSDISEDLFVIGSGGIRDSMDIVRSLVIGADMVGISGEILSYLLHGDIDYVKDYLDGLIYKLKMIMLLMGKKDIVELKKSNYKITGKLKDLI